MSEEDETEMSTDITDSFGADGERKPGLKGVKWTKSEDTLLKSLVEQYGEKWDLVCKQLPDRSDIQCQQRWTKVVNPDLIKGPWTKEVSCVSYYYSGTSLKFSEVIYNMTDYIISNYYLFVKHAGR